MLPTLHDHLVAAYAESGRPWPPRASTRTPPPPPAAAQQAEHLEHVCSWHAGFCNPFFVAPLPERRALVADYGHGTIAVVCLLSGSILHVISLPPHTEPCGSSALRRPLGVARSAASLYVVDGAAACVLQLDLEGRLVRSFGGGGDSGLRACGDDASLPLLAPYGCAFAAAEAGSGCGGPERRRSAGAREPLLYVVDSGRHRVVAYSADGRPRFAFGRRGSGAGCLHDPRGVAVHGGTVWVADMCNHRVALFTAEGAPAGAFGRHGSGPGRMQYPAGVAVSRSLLLVSEYVGGRLHVLSLRGDALQLLTPPPAAAPPGAAGAYLCAVGAGGGCALVPDTDGAVHVFAVKRAGPLERPPSPPPPPRCAAAATAARSQEAAGEAAPRAGGSRDERVGRAMQAAGLGDMLACFEPGDLHALMPAVYADAAAHPEVYRHVAAGR